MFFLNFDLQEAFTVQKKLHTLDRLAWSDMFETFLANK
jgi:2-oxoglutarate dehydrogenase complex dehydrogenase (E1) component-like enzyme